MFEFLILLVSFGFVIAAIVSLWKSRRHSAGIKLIKRAVPVTAGDLRSVPQGQVVSFSGLAETRKPLISFQSETPCVYYDYDVIRRSAGRRRSRHSDGDESSYVVYRSENVAHEKEWAEFRVKNETGYIYVNPEGAYFEPVSVMDQTIPVSTRDRKRLTENGLPGQRIYESSGQGQTAEFLIKENAIPLSTPVHVIGPLNEQGQIESKRSNDVIISHRPISEILDEWSAHSRSRSLGCCGGLVMSVVTMLVGIALVSVGIL